ncbi:MAG: radical SAM protein [Actinomycetia bacterium]|nr:radical SAM protein [Actinomycetes bacterium]
MNLYSSYCELCPRKCGADRAGGARGKCGASDQLQVARAALHFWEEPPVSGTRGSGTVFFSHCPLRCVYCQNYEISSGDAGKIITVERLAEIFCELQDLGAHNINLVTATHYAPAVAAALRLVRPGNLRIPVIWNTSGYELPWTLRRLDGLVDGYLFDLRYTSAELALRYSRAIDYPAVAAAALAAAVAQVGPYTVADSLLVSGVIVRQLLLPVPGGLTDALATLRSSFARYGNEVCYSLMNQYTPMLRTAERYPELSAQVREEDYARLVDEALALGVKHSFMQEGGTVSESFIPPFDGTGV